MRITRFKENKFFLRLTNKNIADITQHTFSDELSIDKVVSKTLTSSTFELTLSEMEILQGHIAFSANHTSNKAVEKRLDNLFFKIDAAIRCLGLH
ncbi:MAG: hypothetical protein RLZZ244_2270 [Verrucomicrobiota bacterium]|jgi:hypothetical protein